MSLRCLKVNNFSIDQYNLRVLIINIMKYRLKIIRDIYLYSKRFLLKIQEEWLEMWKLKKENKIPQPILEVLLLPNFTVTVCRIE